MRKKSTANSALAALVASFTVTLGLSLGAKYIPIFGKIVKMMLRPELLSFGPLSISTTGLATLGYFGSFYMHYMVENQDLQNGEKGAKDTRVMAIANLLISSVGVELVFRLSKHVKFLAATAATLTGYTAIGTAIYLLWTIGMPALMGFCHYQTTQIGDLKKDFNIMDSAYFAFTLSMAAVFGWGGDWLDSWNQSPLSKSQNAGVQFLEKMFPSLKSPAAKVSDAFSKVHTTASILYTAIRPLANSSLTEKQVEAPLNKSVFAFKGANNV